MAASQIFVNQNIITPPSSAMTPSSAALEDHLLLPLSALSIDRNEKVWAIQLQQSEEVGACNFVNGIENCDMRDDADTAGIHHHSHEQPNDCFRHDLHDLTEAVPPASTKATTIRLTMRCNPARNPFSQADITTFQRQQPPSLSANENVIALPPSNFNIANDEFPTSSTPEVMRQCFPVLPPPCRPGQYGSGEMKYENAMPEIRRECLLLPDF